MILRNARIVDIRYAISNTIYQHTQRTIAAVARYAMIAVMAYASPAQGLEYSGSVSSATAVAGRQTQTVTNRTITARDNRIDLDVEDHAYYPEGSCSSIGHTNIGLYEVLDKDRLESLELWWVANIAGARIGQRPFVSATAIHSNSAVSATGLSDSIYKLTTETRYEESNSTVATTLTVNGVPIGHKNEGYIRTTTYIGLGERLSMTCSGDAVVSTPNVGGPQMTSVGEVWATMKLQRCFHVFDAASEDARGEPMYLHKRTQQLIADTDKLMKLGTPRDGVAADGAAQLLIRLGPLQDNESMVSFTLRRTDMGANPQEEGGQLTVPGQPWSGKQTISVYVDPGTHMAFIAYRAPNQFIRSGFTSRKDIESSARVVHLEIQSNGGINASYPLSVVRPPVILVHGLWSNPGQWAYTSAQLRSMPAFSLPGAVGLASYQEYNAASFKVGAAVVYPQIRATKNYYRDGNNIAVGRVDYIGHSMGGDLLRHMYVSMSSAGQWSRIDNYGEGEVHRAILIDSPQAGSTLANALQSSCTTDMKEDLAKEGLVLGGAITDLAVGSAAIRGFGAMPVPSHAVVGVGSERFHAARDLFWDMAIAIYKERNRRVLTEEGYKSYTDYMNLFLLAWLKGASGLHPSDLYGAHRHDCIVAEASQAAGLTSSAISVVTESPEPTPVLHSAILQEMRLSNQIATILNGFDHTQFSHLPEPEMVVPQITCNETLRHEAMLTIVQPQPSRLVKPGERIRVTVQTAPGYNPNAIFVISGFTMLPLTTPPYEVEMTVPDDIGSQWPVSAVGVDAAGNREKTQTIVLKVVRDTSPIGIRAGIRELYLYSPGETFPIKVRGSYSGGAEVDVTSPGMGTTYASSDPGIASVDAEGVVTANKPGRATITIRNRTLQDTVAISVEFGDVTSYGTATPGSLKFAPIVGTRGEIASIGNTRFGVEVSRGLGGANGIIILGAKRSALPLWAGTILVDPLATTMAIPLSLSGVPGKPGDGSAYVPIAVPSAGMVVGRWMYWQALVWDMGAPNYVSMSQGLATKVVLQ